MNIILFDEPSIRTSLLPLTYTRPVAACRVGIMTIAEKWQKHLSGTISYLTEDYLTRKFALNKTEDNYYINGALCPDEKLIAAVQKLNIGEGIELNGQLLIARTPDLEATKESLKLTTFPNEVTLIDQPWKIFKQNAAQIKSDFKVITKGRTSASITDLHTIVYGKENIFIEEGASIKAAILNAESGPIYIGKNAQVHEGAIIKGSFALCEGSHVQMGAKIRGDSTIGPYSKAGGEISNSVIFGYSNKGHDGFIGNTVLGEWCNLGADTNTSNLKNNYDQVKLWSYEKEGFVNTGEQFCGLIMGDHSKSGINTMFNTGTVVGVSANVFGAGFPRNFIPSFSWGGVSGLTTFNIKKANEVAARVLERRNLKYDEVEAGILQHVYENTSSYRIWDKK
ncbi:GlmU family protein [Fulvivirga lutimaris]|uniref:GlmU family protein n=1 Tax=Fulvivirga lutimaris TaxID=1819566 RepID=UPI0012BB8609|nr:GlmU family protein [Fulvivirga lutimaris]MTI39876.1 glucose-1-phosphate thymidylyltransferase [Fulvivirga lutimaris]